MHAPALLPLLALLALSSSTRAAHSQPARARTYPLITRDDSLDLATLPIANKAKITRFLKNVEHRYAATADISQDRWTSASASRLDMTLAHSDNSLQADILAQIKAGITSVLGLPARALLAAPAPKNDLVVAVPLRDIVLDEQQDAEYLAEIKIGTPPRTYLVQADSGSSDLWVAGARCNSKACRGVNGQRARYNTSQSSTYSRSPTNQSFELYYSIGAVKGRMIRDNIALTGKDVSSPLSSASLSLPVRTQTFGIARELTPDFENDHTDGVLGLGFRALTVAGEKPVLENLFAQNAHRLKAKLVAFYLGRASAGTHARSEMRIGAPNPALYKGSLKYVPLTKRAYWSFRFGRFGLAGAAKANTVSGTGTGNAALEGILDTGTSYIAMPYDNAADFWNAVPGAQNVGAYGYWVYDCKLKLSAEFTLPDGTKYTLNPADLNAGKAYSGSSNCIGTIFSADTGKKVIFGASLLKSVYTVFDWGAGRIGFAQAL